jgi:transposase
MDQAWIGIDVGKDFHWAVALDESGRELLSRRVENEEADIRLLLEEVSRLARRSVWAVDMAQGPVALLAALLAQAEQEVLYVPGMVVNRSRGALGGESKTDRRDAHVIAENVRMRRDLEQLRAREDSLAALRLLVAHRRDLVADRVRLINRLRETLVVFFPGLERALDFRLQGPLQLVCAYPTPAKIRRSGKKRMAAHLRAQGVVRAEELAEKALLAAQGQSVRLPGEDIGATLVKEIAGEVLRLAERLSALDREIAGHFFSHPQAKIIASLPGMGPRLGAEFLVAVGDLAYFPSADKLAAYAGLAPVSQDSGKRQGRLRRARGGNRLLKHVFYLSAFASLSHPDSREFYDRKRAEGKKHKQAVIALARRRVNVLWAMLRDGTLYADAQTALTTR